MDSGQIVIKVILIAVFAVLALFLIVPSRGTRNVALRRLLLVLAFALAVVGVVFPEFTNVVANAVGVGRGADLLLYGMIVVFVGTALTSAAHQRRLEREMTILARRIAIDEAPAPTAAPTPTEAPVDR